MAPWVGKYYAKLREFYDFRRNLTFNKHTKKKKNH